MACLINIQTLKMISQVESFPFLDLQGTPDDTAAETICNN